MPEIRAEPAVVNGSSEAKVEDHAGDVEKNGEGDQQMYSHDQDGDDDIDFNLGNGNDYREPTTHHGGHGPGIKEDG
jgi:hypothetical protein